MDLVEKSVNGLILMTAPHISVPHGFTTRFGGVSEGIYASLNLGENRGDKPEAVRENYRRLKAALRIDKLCFTKQVHKNHVRPVTGSDAREPYGPLPYEADGIVTAEPGLALIAFTADCIPILLHDPKRTVSAALHAGWRGTVADIAGAGAAAMVRLGSAPEDIRAAIGPGISFSSFETGPEVPEAVRAVLGDRADAFIRESENPGKFYVDLKGVNRALLIRAGLKPENIAVSGECTLQSPDKYWSHRATNGERGAQAAVIVNGESLKCATP